ncbi:MAG: LPP20 family lipoprotein [Deltaproteobacteria bacterium]|nr:LPP20 family lipoprotein [Deltaproteobacteria bacterium]
MSTRLSFSTTLGLAASLLACGGGQPPSGSPATTAEAPEWVHKGTHVGQGRIVGVGSAGGMQNTELARTTATNRGRAEISKILEVYSASLMKDFQESVKAGAAPSDESQLVTQAIKTFSAQLLEGTEVGGYWFDPGDNTWYGMVVLDFARQREIAAAKANMPGGVKKWVDENGDKVLGDLETETGRHAPPASPPAEQPAQAAEPPPPPPPPVAPGPGPAPKVGGEPPAWTKGKNTGGACDAQKFLCGVGSGKKSEAADIAARAELARIFESNIKSIQTSFEGAARKIASATGEQWAEVQKVTSFSMVSTDKVVRMSEIAERWQDKSSTYWTLAVIDRAQASAALREQIQVKDQIVDAELSRAQGTEEKLARFRALRKAVSALVEREAMNSDLRVIEKSGQGVPSPHNIGEVVAMLEGATESLSIGVAVAGSAADKVQACLEEGLTARGYQVEAKSQEEDDEDPDISGKYDVLIKATIKGEKRGVVAGSEVVNLTLTVKLIDGAKNKVLKTITANKKASRGDVKSAAATAAHQMCTQKMNEVLNGIDQYFGKK